MLRQLKRKKSEEYDLYLGELDDMERDELFDEIEAFQLSKLREDAVREVVLVEEDFTPENLVASLEHDEHVEKAETRLQQDRESWAKDALEQYMSTVRESDDDRLREIAKEIFIDSATRNSFITEWRDVTLYHACWIDDDTRLFPSREAMARVSPAIKNVLFSEYMRLDRASQDPSF
jgi:hypothetical protein